jgi:hypothetical protein
VKYEVKMSRPSNGKRPSVTLPYWHGSALHFDAESFLLCIALDTQAAQNCTTFEDFAADYGYDADSLSAFRTFEAMTAQAKRLNEWATTRMIADLLTVEEDA